MPLCSLPSGMLLALFLGGGACALAAGLFLGLHFAHLVDADAGRGLDLELGPEVRR